MHLSLTTLICALTLLVVPEVEAAGLGKSVARGLARSGARKLPGPLAKATGARFRTLELRRDVRTPARPLLAPRTVRRYVSAPQAQKELREGIARNHHLTFRAAPGRPMNGELARERLGLVRQPTAVETVKLPKGFPVRANRVPHGSRGQWELTSPKRVSPGAITKVTRIR